MEIDPVVVLADELRATEAALRSAMQRYEKNHKRENGDAVDRLLESVKVLRRDVFTTVPTSALGAGELVRMVAQYLPFTFATYSTHFHEVADRLSAGQRRHDDLVWLRSMRAALAGGICSEAGVKFAPLLELALQGASRPVIVFRNVAPVHDHPHNPTYWAKRLN
ncbi:MAG: hypothetical protein BGN85_03010 [Alphaproteobacteria bacterium 64-11]|nr:hypothetical protein [Alphaproteobacteria bacterium]OJU08657.1 MAG: hypothetical protein BGN85_03010 [Alphaproteobacteria bacterium 64-11]